MVLHVARRFGSDVADSVVDQLSEALERIASNPQIGHSREELTTDPTIRFWSVGPTLLAYRTRQERVEVLIVERGEMNWKGLLEELP